MKRIALAALIALCLAGCSSSRQGVDLEEGAQKPDNIFYHGGNGDTYETAVKIDGSRDPKVILAAEYAFISKQYGKKGKDWRVASQSLSKEKNKVFDIMEIELLPQGYRRYYYFDVSGSSSRAKAEYREQQEPGAPPATEQPVPEQSPQPQ